MSIENEFLNCISTYNLLQNGDTVAVGLSGGADSMCLLSLLVRFKKQLGIEVCAAHVNHCLRGAESDEDEVFVKNYCSNHGIKLFTLKADIRTLSENSGESIELCARKVRYDFFATLPCSKIATAHTGTDCIETMFMNLCRGASLQGLSSIPPKRDKIIRPLITILRKDTQGYCKENNIAFVTDSSNLTDEYTRNKVRHNVIPALKNIYPEFETNALRCLSSIREDNAFLNQQTVSVFSSVFNPCDNVLSIAELSNFPENIQKRVVAHFIKTVTQSDFESKHISLLLEHAKDCHYTLTLPDNVYIEVNNGLCSLVKPKKDYSVNPILLDKNVPQTVTFGDYFVSIDISDVKSSSKNEYSVDFSAIDDIILIRSKENGDKIKLINRNCTKTLKKLFTELKLDEKTKKTLPVIADSKGVIAVSGIGADAHRFHSTQINKYLIIKTESVKND